MMLNSNKVLLFRVLISFTVCIAGNLYSQNNSALKNTDSQFESLYQKAPLLSLPLSYSDSLIGSIEFIEMPESLFPTFKFDDEIYERALYIVKLPEYKNIKIIIIKVYPHSGGKGLFLCTILNNRIIDKLEIYSMGDTEYNSRTDAISLTSFSIKNNYEIMVKDAIIADGKEINVTRKTYMIDKTGKFVEK